MEPNIAHLSSFHVAGLTERTNNRDESTQDSAKIPGLWGRFFSGNVADTISRRVPDAPIVGVYWAYESDASGDYAVTAGVAVSVSNPDFDNIEIQAGKYLVFEASGPMPAAVIQAWVAIWAYFEAHPQVKRSFATDFESYVGQDHVQVHIGIAS